MRYNRVSLRHEETALTTARHEGQTMKSLLKIGLFMSAVFVGAANIPTAHELPSGTNLSAPTYYVAAEVVGCEPDPNYTEFRGATNLPPGALMTAVVTDFDSDGWKNYSDEVYVPVTREGFFAGEVQPKKGMLFHRNLMLQVYFAPFRPTQPENVLKVVGRKGEKLREVADVRLEVSKGFERPAVNPQLVQWSGDVSGLWTIARVPNCGEKH